jgi:hypothetical protein
MLHPWSHVLYSLFLIPHPIFLTFCRHSISIALSSVPYPFRILHLSTIIHFLRRFAQRYTSLQRWTRTHTYTFHTYTYVEVNWVQSPAIVHRRHIERANDVFLLCHQCVLLCILAYVAGRGSPDGTSQIQIWIWNAREIATHPPKCIVEATSSLSFAAGATCGFTAFLVWLACALFPAIVPRDHTRGPSVLLPCHQCAFAMYSAYVPRRGAPGGTSQIQIWIWKAREIATYRPKCIAEPTSSLGWITSALG